MSRDIAAAKQVFLRYLRSHLIKDTTARRSILDTVLQLSGHFEAERVVTRLREAGARTGKATVYRTLPLLVDCGILKQVRLDGVRTLFEYSLGENPHDHMVCRRCARIIEFASDDVLKLRDLIARRHRFHVTGHRLQLSGLCESCASTCPLSSDSARANHIDGHPSSG